MIKTILALSEWLDANGVSPGGIMLTIRATAPQLAKISEQFNQELAAQRLHVKDEGPPVRLLICGMPLALEELSSEDAAAEIFSIIEWRP